MPDAEIYFFMAYGASVHLRESLIVFNVCKEGEIVTYTEKGGSRMSELCKILIVDDELLVRQGLRHHLNWEQHGFQIVGEAANGKEALEMVQRLQPHIVIADIVMPVMDGEQFTRILKAHYPHIEVIVLSSYGQFHYVRSSFQSGVADYILKPKLETDELLKVLYETARKIPGVVVGAPPAGHAAAGSFMADGAGALASQYLVDRQLERMLAGYDSDDTYSETFKDYFPYDGYVLFGADLSRIPGDPRRYLPALADSVMERLQREPWSERTVCKVLNSADSDKHLVILLNMPSEQFEAARHVVRKLSEEQTASLSGIVWAISPLFANIEQLSHVYREEWLELLAYRFYFPGRTFMTSEELPPVNDLPAIDMNLLLEDLRRQNMTAAFTRIRHYVEEAVKHYVMPPFELKAQLGNIIFHIAIGLSVSGGRSERVKKLDKLKYVYFKAIDDAADVTEAAASLEEFLHEVEKLLPPTHAVDANMQKLLAYIEEHYSEPLRLSSLSEHFHFNPSYLSGYFSSHHPEGFSEYLNKTRINKACELLASSELSISEISAKVGYADHSYFTKVFKKHIGISPSQYRRQSRSPNAATNATAEAVDDATDHAIDQATAKATATDATGIRMPQTKSQTHSQTNSQARGNQR